MAVLGSIPVHGIECAGKRAYIRCVDSPSGSWSVLLLNAFTWVNEGSRLREEAFKIFIQSVSVGIGDNDHVMAMYL